jgi:hypothetical protein
MISAQGADGHVTVDEKGNVTITRTGRWGKLAKAAGTGDEVFNLSNVEGIGFKKWSMVSGKGHVQFGLVEQDGTSFFTKSTLEITKNSRHSVIYNKNQQSDFERLLAYCKPLIGGAVVKFGNDVGQVSKDEQLRRLTELHDLGVLSESEFNREKKNLN